MTSKCDICGDTLSELANFPASSICNTCGLIVTDGSEAKEEAGQVKLSTSSAIKRLRLKYTLHRLMKALKGLPPTARILEVGFDSGAFLTMLFIRGFKALYGIDRVAELPEISDGLGNRLEPENLKNAFLEDVGLPGDFHDCVVMVHVIEHLRNPRLSIRKLRDSLKESGILYIVTPNSASIGRKLFKGKWGFYDHSHFWLFTPDALGRMLRDEGYEVLSHKRLLFDSFTFEAYSMLAGGKTRIPASAHLIFVLIVSSVFFLLRLIVPGLRPAFEIVARKA